MTKDDENIENSPFSNIRGDELKNKLKSVELVGHAIAMSNTSRPEESLSNIVKLWKNETKDIAASVTPFYKGKTNDIAGFVIQKDNDIMICYHGTRFNSSGISEMKNDSRFIPSKMKFGNAEVNVHSGFKAEYEESKENLLGILGILAKSKNDKKIHVAGHSLGGAVAQLAALDLRTNYGQENIDVTTFGGAKVFQKDAVDLYNKVGLDKSTIRIIGKGDIVPKLLSGGLGYAHAGYKIKVDVQKHGMKHYNKNQIQNLDGLEQADNKHFSIYDYMSSMKNVVLSIETDAAKAIASATGISKFMTKNCKDSIPPKTQQKSNAIQH